MSSEEMPVLNRQAVADLIGVKAKTISQYLVESRGEGRYAGHPFPPPDGYIGKGPWWRKERAGEIKTWAEKRPGQGVGGGRPRRTKTS